jgi:NTP pyrophosphatase (non-canonical NTP hydrolase)
MEERLEANDHKKGWSGKDPRRVSIRLLEECAELMSSLENTIANPCEMNVDHTQREAADVANFALMIYDIANRLRENQ